jgi:hypothetical protein
MADKFSSETRTYEEAKTYRITIQGLTESARMAVLGRHITAEERQAMIREAAYLRAEQRGFVGGSPEEDWVLAEQEVDERLLQQAGLVTKGRRALISATSSVEQELGSIKDVVTRWLEGEGDVARQPETRKAAEKKETAEKSAPKKNTREPVKKTAAKKTKAKPKTKLKAKTETKKAEGTKVTNKKKAKVKQSARAR